MSFSSLTVGFICLDIYLTRDDCSVSLTSVFQPCEDLKKRIGEVILRMKSLNGGLLRIESDISSPGDAFISVGAFKCFPFCSMLHKMWY